ncbi:MAG: hypothetical protein H6Q38_2078 [Chloroflexi bacterium]|nr:hypothetical protein [Chloroflexota bacterium]
MDTQIQETHSNGYKVDEDGKSAGDGAGSAAGLAANNATRLAGAENGSAAGQKAAQSMTAKTGYDLFDALLEIRSELEDLQYILDNIRRGKTIIPDYAAYIVTTKENLHDLMKIVNEFSALPKDRRPREAANNVDTIRHINNLWEQMEFSPLIAHPGVEPKGSADVQKELHYLDLLDEQIHSLVYQIGILTIPHQIGQWKDKTRPGYFIPFHEVFAADLPLAADRDRMLKYISLTPELIEGFFTDVENGRLYRYSTSPFRRLVSLGMVILALALATGIVAAACFINKNGSIPAWPLAPADLPKMLMGWGAILAGMGVHVVVGSAKRSKTQNGMPSVLMDLILIIDARFGEIVMKLTLGLIGLFGLVMISTTRLPVANVLNNVLQQAVPAVGNGTAQPSLITQVTPLNAFLVGYSLDSIIELFGTSMESASQVKSLIPKGG